MTISGAGSASEARLLTIGGGDQRVQFVVPLTSIAVGEGSTGALEFPVTQAQALDALYVPNPTAVAQKVLDALQIEPAIAHQLATCFDPEAEVCGSSPARDQPVCPSADADNNYCAPQAHELPGQVNNKQLNPSWCGPASAHNLLAQMGVHETQSTLATAMNTSREGTYVHSVLRTLNQKQSYDTFVMERVDSASAYMARIASSTWRRAAVGSRAHGLIANIHTRPLFAWWGNHGTRHYHVVYGYDTTEGGRVKVAEEYDPTEFGSLPRDYQGKNPYGTYWVPLKDHMLALKKGTGYVFW